MSFKQQFLETYEEEHQKTMRVLRAFPPEKSELKVHPRMKSARELAWIFVQERHLGNVVLSGQFGQGPRVPPVPASWDEVLPELEKQHKVFGDLVKGFSDEQLQEKVKFITGPQKVGEFERIKFCWFLLHDQIHHRGQFTVFLRHADAKVPSIYGPSGDEKWT